MSYEFHGVNYADTGCSVHPACLSCPLPRCKYDITPSKGLPSSFYKARRKEVSERRTERDVRMKQMRAAGVPVADIAKEFGVNRVRVYQVTAA